MPAVAAAKQNRMAMNMGGEGDTHTSMPKTTDKVREISRVFSRPNLRKGQTIMETFYTRTFSQTHDWLIIVISTSFLDFFFLHHHDISHTIQYYRHINAQPAKHNVIRSFVFLQCFSPVSNISKAQAAYEDTQYEAHFLHWDQPILRAHQIPLPRQKPCRQEVRKWQFHDKRIW